VYEDIGSQLKLALAFLDDGKYREIIFFGSHTSI